MERCERGVQLGGGFRSVDRLRGFAKFGQAREVFFAVGVIVGERFDEVRNGAFERVEVGKNESGRDEIGRGNIGADLF